MQLTYEELLTQFKIRAGLSPRRDGCSIDIASGFDADGLMEQHIRSWYASLIENAPAEMLDPENVAPLLSATALPDGSAEVVLPPQCRRIFTIKLRGWEREAEVVDAADHPRLCRVLSASSSIRRTSHPYAIRRGRTITLYSLPPDSNGSPEVIYATGAIVIPDGDTFRFSPAALSSITPPSYNF